ncbi:MAG TPA: hypothetical protein PKC91_11775 [Ignavibacteria bacterium]|nr:hypothetical protein [Ignavibacteria bacterium]
MKLRIKGNSLRLRLTKSEVKKLCTAGYLEERISFGGNELIYSLQSTETFNEIKADYSGNKIAVAIPSSFIKDWEINDIICLDSGNNINDQESLYILIEKDFQCLDKTTEDQSDNYENPNKTC